MSRDALMLDVLLALPHPMHGFVIRMLPPHYCARLARIARQREALAIAHLTEMLEEINEAMREFVRLAESALPSDDGTAHRRDPSA